MNYLDSHFILSFVLFNIVSVVTIEIFARVINRILIWNFSSRYSMTIMKGFYALGWLSFVVIDILIAMILLFSNSFTEYHSLSSLFSIIKES